MPKIKTKLIFKTKLIEKTYFLLYQTTTDFKYKVGQFFSLEVAPRTFRAYSVAYASQVAPDYFTETKNLPTLDTEKYVGFMISTKPGGLGSQYAETAEPYKSELNFMGPTGKFLLQDNDKPKAFIATGTGLAPFVPMIETVLNQNNQAKINLFFAAWNLASDFVKQFFEKYYNNPKFPNFQIYSVIDEFKPEELSEFVLGGRVTTEVPKVIPNLSDWDYYLCGHPAMVSAMEEVLIEKGVKDGIYKEKFG